MNKMKSQTRNRLLLLLLVASLSGLLYLMPMDYPLPGFIMKLRSQKLLAYLLVAIAGGLATISFQTITENRFLTPSILGMESLYVFMQTIYLFFASKFIGNTGHPLLEFILVLWLLFLPATCIKKVTSARICIYFIDLHGTRDAL